MMIKSRIKLITIAVLMITSVILIPAVSAKEDTYYSVTPVLSAKEKTTYTVGPSIYKEPNLATKLVDTISQGETNRHSVSVGSRVNSLEVYLNWYTTSDALSLTIYTPSWTNIGTFYDSDDGQTDGKIHIDISPGGSYVDSGTWSFDVYGYQVSSSRSYQFTVEQH